MADGQHGGKRVGAGRKPGARNLLTIDGQTEAQVYGPEAIKRAAELAGLVKGRDGMPAGVAKSEAVQVSALNIIIERAYGKAAQPLHHGDHEGGQLQPVLNILGSVARVKPPASREAGTRVPNSRH